MQNLPDKGVSGSLFYLLAECTSYMINSESACKSRVRMRESDRHFPIWDPAFLPITGHKYILQKLCVTQQNDSSGSGQADRTRVETPGRTPPPDQPYTGRFPIAFLHISFGVPLSPRISMLRAQAGGILHPAFFGSTGGREMQLRGLLKVF